MQPQAIYSRVRRRLLEAADRLTAATELLADEVPARGAEAFVIVDDIFPHPLSAFRIAEYNQYLRLFPTAQVHSSGGSFRLLGKPQTFRSVRASYERQFPEFRGRVQKYHVRRRRQGAVAYTIFLNNAHDFLPFFERNRSPLVFTLYPGGGFALDDPASDQMLKRVCSYPLLRKIIVTQKNTMEYLLERGFCGASEVEFVYGGVFPSDRLPATSDHRVFFRTGKRTLDVCFVAHKYMPGGRDKGYDVFVRTAELLHERFDDVCFHVVGPFDSSDLDVSRLGETIRFYGSRETSFFRNFYAQMDIILSPNAPFLVQRGRFDGFPTGACMEAGMSGVAVFCTDELNLNVVFRHGEDIVIVPRSAESIADSIAAFHEDPEALHRLQVAGQAAFRKVFDIDRQMARRLDILSPLLASAASAKETLP